MLNFYLAAVETPEERELIHRLYSDYRLMMYKIAFAILKNSYDSEDAIHNAFVNIINKGGMSKLKEFDKQAERAYITAVVKNAAIKLYDLRRKNAAENINDFYSLESNESTENTVFGGFGVKLVSKALLKLSESDYEILYLSVVNGFSDSELAEHFDIREDAVRQRISRAKKRLRKILENEEVQSDDK
ncbi:MAG: sigma-70 family RNA polymerase sigma factor [Bacteroides sp.]|nr:sigma-70 family RNA polymerase sigma factor [Bacteroides sp.]